MQGNAKQIKYFSKITNSLYDDFKIEFLSTLITQIDII